MKHIHGNAPWLMVIVVVLGLHATAGQTLAQPLDPKAWFPLELGNAWHYKINADDASSTDQVLISARDSLVDGRRWVLFYEIDCAGYFCGGNSEWYSMTDDNYLLQNLSATSPPDTFFATTPHAFFEVTETDTVKLNDPSCGPDLRVAVAEEASVADSTRFRMYVAPDNIFCGSHEYVYKIGLARVPGEGADGTRLVGAYVNGYRYGDQTRLSTVLAAIEPAVPRATLELFPNPATETVTVISPTRVEEIRIVDVIGRTVKVACCRQQEWTIDVADLPAGIYFVLLPETSQTMSTVLVKQ